MLSIYRMSKKGGKTFRLAFVRRRINTMFRSRALRAALLAELNGGQDAALVVQMVERVTPIVRPPTQAVAPMPQQNEEEVAPEAPVDPPTHVEAPPQGQVRPVDHPTQTEAPPQVQATSTDGHTAATAVEISDTDSELSDND